MARYLSGFQRDSTHHLVIKPSAEAKRREGYVRTAARSLGTVTTGGIRNYGGLLVDAKGRVVINIGGAIAKTREQLPRDSAGALCCSENTTLKVHNGFGLDSVGRVCIVEGS